MGASGPGWPNSVTVKLKTSGDSLSRKISTAPAAKEISFETGYIASEWVYGVHVLHTERQKYLATFEFRKKFAAGTDGGDTGYGDFDHALSPDGSKIAILRGSTLELYR